MCQSQSLDQHQWKHRVILLFAPNLNDSILNRQVQEFNALSAELIDRNLVVYQITPTQVVYQNKPLLPETAKPVLTLYDRYDVQKEAFAVILIGKDGGRKLQSVQWTSPNTIFRLIDSMPMRQSEMRRKKGG